MYDVVIVGAGISGTSLAFELSKYEGNILLLDKENDVADETTKANSAIIHAGYDPAVGTNMARYNVEGNTLIKQLCKDLDVPCKQIGSLVVAFQETERESLQEIYDRGVCNGVKGLRIVEHEELMQMEENLNPKAIAALYAPSACIVNPWDMAIAFAETAVKNGVDCRLQQDVLSIQKKEDVFLVQTQDEIFETRNVINAAGVSCDRVASMVGKVDYHITPNKGQYYLLDKSQGELVHHVIFQCPTKEGKGTLVAPTVHGNLIVGPTSETCMEGDISTTQVGLDMIKERALLSIPNINFRENIRSFSGIRAKRKDNGDFVIGEDPTVKGFYHIAAMQSPGLSSAPAIALAIRKELQQKGFFHKAKKDPITTRTIVRFKEMSSEERTRYIQQNPAYGRIICRCETISEGEILDAIHRVITPVSLDGIKRRCNTGMGRCQGGFCGPKVQELLARELHVDQQDIVQDKAGSYILVNKTKEGGTSR